VSDHAEPAAVIPFPAVAREPSEPLPDGSLVLCHVAGRWRTPEVERLRAEADTARIAERIAARNRL
jgi:hypothetical protein